MEALKDGGHFTSWGISPATTTKLVSLALRTLELLNIYPTEISESVFLLQGKARATRPETKSL